MLFRCGTCRRVYKDYMPVDDSCTKCDVGRIRLFRLPENTERERLKREAGNFALRRYARRRAYALIEHVKLFRELTPNKANNAPGCQRSGAFFFR